MLRFTLLSLSMLMVSIVLFGCRMQSAKAANVDKVSAAEALMNAR